MTALKASGARAIAASIPTGAEAVYIGEVDTVNKLILDAVFAGISFIDIDATAYFSPENVSRGLNEFRDAGYIVTSSGTPPNITTRIDWS